MTGHVAYVLEAYPTFIVNEIQELRRQGVAVTLLSAFRPRPPKDAAADALRRESLYFPDGYRGVAGANLRALAGRPGSYLGLVLLLLSKGESLRLLLLGAWLAAACRERGVGHVHGTFGTRTATLACVVARLAGLEFSFTTHAYDVFHDNRSLSWKTRAARFMRTISAFNRDYILATYSGIPPERVVVQHLGVDTQALRPTALPAEDSDAPLVISVASLIPQKGHLESVRAVARLVRGGRALRLEIVGEGPERAALEAEIAALGVAHAVTLRGQLSHAETLERLRHARLFVLPCLDLRGRGQHVDGIPVALMEAMAVGLPVISTPLSGIPELVEDGVSGRLVPAGDDAALAEAVQSLLADAERSATLGRAARERVVSRFDLAANTAKLAALFAGRAA